MRKATYLITPAPGEAGLADKENIMEAYKEKTRERRIRNRERMISRARNYELQNYPVECVSDQGRHRREKAEMHARKYHNNIKACSCDICCNPRHSGWYKGKNKLTIQELKAMRDEKEQKNER